MSLRVAVAFGMAAAVAVPAILTRTGATEEGVLTGRVIPLPLGGGMELHWSWLIFCGATLLAWLLLGMRDR
jgi:hypothetical protein